MGPPGVAGVGIRPATGAGVRPPAPSMGPPGGAAVRPPMPVRTAYSKPIALRLDDQGREVDDFGNLVERKADVVTTFKVGTSVCERIGWSAV